jgi:hypothetical protein
MLDYLSQIPCVGKLITGAGKVYNVVATTYSEYSAYPLEIAIPLTIVSLGLDFISDSEKMKELYAGLNEMYEGASEALALGKVIYNELAMLSHDAYDYLYPNSDAHCYPKLGLGSEYSDSEILNSLRNDDVSPTGAIAAAAA